MPDLTTIFHHLQRQLFPTLASELGPLAALDQQFCEVISLTNLGRFTRRYDWCGDGAPPAARPWLAHAFLAKSGCPFPNTTALLDALPARPRLRSLCGWDNAGAVPSVTTFSRAFTALANGPVPQPIHARLVKPHAGPKLVGHVSRAALAIEAPERPAPKPALRSPGPAQTPGTPAHAHAGGEPGGPARPLRRGLQAQPQGASGKLAWLQAAAGHRGGGLPRERGADQCQGA